MTDNDRSLLEDAAKAAGYPTQIDLCEGKYSIIYNFKTGQSECLRYGEKWRDLCGDKMVLSMFDEIVALRARIAELEKERDELKTVPMKYRRMEFNAQLQEDVKRLEADLSRERELRQAAIEAMKSARLALIEANDIIDDTWDCSRTIAAIDAAILASQKENKT